MKRACIQFGVGLCGALISVHPQDALAVTNERLPVTMKTSTVMFFLEAQQETGSYPTKILGLPTFDVRLGSLDVISIQGDTFYNASGQFVITSTSDSGSGRYDTGLSIKLGSWIQDSTSSVPFDSFTQDIHTQYTCSPCQPGVGTISEHSFPEQFSGTFTTNIAGSTGFRLTGTSASAIASTLNIDQGIRLSVNYQWGGTLAITPTYTAYTTRQYLDQSVARASGFSGWYDRSSAVAHEMVSLRNLPDGSGSRNEALRTAEYGIMSFWAAQQWVYDPSVGTLVSFFYQGPYGVVFHNALKGCRILNSICREILNTLQPVAPNALPSSSPGGTVGSSIAWIHGIAEPDDLEGLGLAMEAGSTALSAPAQAFAKDGLTGVFNLFSERTQRGEIQRLPALDRGGLQRSQLNTATPSPSDFTDGPANAKAFIVLVAGNGISHLALPNVGALQNISSFTLVLGDTSYDLIGGVLYDLVALSGAAVEGLFITDVLGQYPSAGLAIDVVFTETGAADVLQMAAVQVVPEPSSQALMFSGLCVLLVARRWWNAATRNSLESRGMRP